MFRYGGPIKEGVMHGMKNGGRAALVGNPVYPKTDGREHHAVVSGTIATVAGLNALRHAAMRVGARYLPRIISRAKRMFGTTTPASITKGGPRVGEAVGSHTPITINPAKFNPNWLGRDPLVRTVGAAGKAIFNPTVGGWAGKAARFATSPSTLIGGLWFANGRWFNKKGDELDPNSTEVANAKAGAKWDPGAGADQYDPSTSPAALAAAAKKARTEKLSKYLDMMGYDRAKKTAMSDALIDASAIVQQGTEEGGSLKHADWSKMINQAIQTTSKRYDKPEAIREAVGLMMTKGAIEKDIAAEKGSALDIQEKYYTGKLGEAGAERKMLGKPTSLSEAVNLTKATDTTGNRTSQALRHYFDGHLVPEFKGKISKEKLDALGGVEDLVTGVSIGLGDGVYQVSNSYIIVKGNKIIGADDVFATEN